jgi:hypothetical protein
LGDLGEESRLAAYLGLDRPPAVRFDSAWAGPPRTNPASADSAWPRTRRANGVAAVIVPST